MKDKNIIFLFLISLLLEADLGISGDDGVDFIDTFFEKFDIEPPSDFQYAHYFDEEGIDPLTIKDFY